MKVARLNVVDLARAARTDMLAAMALLPAGAALSRAPFGVPFVVAQDYATARQVLVSDANSYRKPWMIRKVIEDGLGENLFTTDGDDWLARRQPCAPVFAAGEVESLTATVVSTVSRELATWRPGEIDIQAAMTDLTMNVALRALLGTGDETADLAVEIRREFEEILDWITFRFNRPTSFPARVPTPRNRRLIASKQRLREVLAQLIRHRRESDSGSVDVFGQLLRAQHDAPDQISDEMILDECIGFMFAGHETTASTLTWALYELSLRPELQDAVAGEASAVTSPTGSGIYVAATLPITSAVVDETLRLYPAGISIARSAKRTTNISGEHIRRGTLVLIPVYSIQRSPSVWEDPDSFDPARRIDGNGDGFLPFGLGPRRCLGARFARTEMNIALSMICSRWLLAYEQDEPPRPVVAPSLRADGQLPLKFTSRASPTNSAVD